MAVLYMDRASIESLTEKDIRDIIEENATDTKYGNLYDYYIGNHKILRETKRDSTAPNNRLVYYGYGYRLFRRAAGGIQFPG